jgi:hypothetical protein
VDLAPAQLHRLAVEEEGVLPHLKASGRRALGARRGAAEGRGQQQGQAEAEKVFQAAHASSGSRGSLPSGTGAHPDRNPPRRFAGGRILTLNTNGCVWPAAT